MLFGHLRRGLSGGSSSGRKRRGSAFAQAIECLEDRRLLAVMAPLDFATDVPVRIDNGSTSVSPLDVQGVTGRVTDVNVSLTIEHPYSYDLAVTLITPAQQRILLTDMLYSLGGTPGVVQVAFDDETAFMGGTPGSIMPTTPLALADGEAPNGTWRLEVVDAMGWSAEGGWLRDWSLSVTGGGTPVAATYNTPTLIPDNQTVTQFPLDVPLTPGEILDVNVRLDITHPSVNDLRVALISPTGTRVQLFRNIGVAGEDFRNTRFDDASPNVLNQSAAPFNGVFQPSAVAPMPADRLDSIAGENATGTWVLEIEDSIPANQGTLNNWSLMLTTVPGQAEVRGLTWQDDNNNGDRDATILMGENPNVVFVVDVSSSTSGPLGGFTLVGDQNGDLAADTILDAEIAGYKAMVQHMIDAGWGASGTVSIVVFGRQGVVLDMNPALAGTQHATLPLADADGNGLRDVDQILSSIQYGHAGADGAYTNYESALQQAEAVFNAIGTTAGNGNLIFLTDGMPDSGGSYQDEADRLTSLGVNKRAFGVGFSVMLAPLQIIDPDADIFYANDDMVDLFGGAAGGTRYLENAIAGATVYVDLDDSGTFDVGEPSAVSGTDGGYIIYGLPAGLYTVRQVPIPGWTEPQPTDGVDVFLFPGSVSTDVNFGNRPLVGDVTGTVFADRNGNGAYDIGIDIPLPNWQVYIDANNNAAFDAGETAAFSGADGLYTFAGLIPTSYVLRVVPQGDYAPILASRDIVVPASLLLAGQDFGTLQSATLGGVVFEDINGNGGWARNEPFISGVTVYLDTNGNGQLDAGERTTTTDSAGNYSFANLAPGIYTLRHVPKTGYWASAAHANVHVVGVGGGENLAIYSFADQQPRPEIDVKKVRTNAKPSAAARTHFGWVNVDGGAATRTFVIRNLGSTTLKLTGLPWVSFKTRRSSFLILTAPGRSIAPGKSTKLTVRFDPVADGIHKATIVIPTNDGDENPFKLNVQGNGWSGRARSASASPLSAPRAQAAAPAQASPFSAKRIAADVLS